MARRMPGLYWIGAVTDRPERCSKVAVSRFGVRCLKLGRFGVTSGMAPVFGEGLFSFDPGLFNKRPQFGYCFFIVSDVRDFQVCD